MATVPKSGISEPGREKTVTGFTGDGKVKIGRWVIAGQYHARLRELSQERGWLVYRPEEGGRLGGGEIQREVSNVAFMR